MKIYKDEKLSDEAVKKIVDGHEDRMKAIVDAIKKSKQEGKEEKLSDEAVKKIVDAIKKSKQESKEEK
jgi:isopropylmalate/homocitrate/citramalate synthase